MEYEDGDELKYLKCFHNFHKDCIDKWFEQSKLCAICKVNQEEDKSF